MEKIIPGDRIPEGTHKEDYKKAYIKQLHKEIRYHMRELNTLMIKFDTLDESFEEWYKMYFPLGG